MVNRSDSLIAFRQQNCDHWDLLGAAESCDYTWDDPLGTRALQIYACDATGLYSGLSGAGTYTFARKAGKATACPELKLDNNNIKPDKSSTASAGSESSKAAPAPQAARPAGAAHARLQALESPLLLSAACSLVTAYAPRPRTRRGATGADSYESAAAARRSLTRESGWLCLTSTHVLFVPFEKPGEGGKGSVLGMRLSRTRRNTSHGTAGAAGAATAATAGIGESLHNIHQLQHAPLKLEEIAHVRAGALPGELLIFTRLGSHVVARSLYQAEALRERIASQHQKVRGDRYSRSSRLSTTSSGPLAQAKDASAEGGWAPNIQTGRSSTRSVPPSREGATRTVQAMVRTARARRELRRRRVERLYETGHSAIAKVLVRAKHAPLLLGGSSVPGPLRFQSYELLEAVRTGNLPSVRELLELHADPDSIDQHGLGALHVACAHTQPQLLALLLEAGADVELPADTRHGIRPLHAAAATASRAEGFACVSQLLAAGADPTATRVDGRTPAQLTQDNTRARRALHSAEALWALHDTERTPRPALVHAVATGKAMRVQELLLARTHSDSIDEHGTGAVHAACARGDDAAPLLQMLLEAGASANRAARDTLGSRPLHCAAQSASLRCLELLLAAHADPTRRDRMQRLPAELCGGGEGGASGPSHAALQVLTRVMQQRQHQHQHQHQHHASSSKSSATRSLGWPAIKVSVVLKGPVSELRLHNEADDARMLESEEADEAEAHDALVQRDQSTAVLLDLRLEGVSLSLIDGEPRELVHVSFHKLRLRASRSQSEQSLELRLARLQVDAAVAATKFPVMLAPVPHARVASAEGETGETEVCVEFSVTHNRRWHSLIYLEYVGLAVRPLRLQLEQNTIARLLRLLDSLARIEDKANRAVAQIPAHANGSQRPTAQRPNGPTAQRPNGSQSAATKPGAGGSGSGKPAMLGVDGHVADGWPRADSTLEPSDGGSLTRARADSERGALPATFLKFYLQELELHPVSLTLTVQMDMVCDEPELQRFHPTSSLVGVARHLVSLQNVTVTFDRFQLEEVFDTGDTLLNRVARYYAVKATLQLYKLIGSLDLLGNPAAIFADVGGGVREMYSEGRKGHMVRSLGALTTGVVGGTGALTMGATSGLMRGLSEAASALSMDKKYHLRRQIILQKPALSGRRGLYLGAQAFCDGCASGIAGVVRQPFKGARESGAKGLMYGVVKGTIGLIMKPLSGTAAAISKAAEGVASEVKHVQKAGAADDGAPQVLRVRQPRDMRAGVLMPYPRAFHVREVAKRRKRQRRRSRDDLYAEEFI